MIDPVDIIIIGAGPAGMAAAQVAGAQGARTLVLDEQRAPGGQIYKAIEATENRPRPELGETYNSGLSQARAFRDSAVHYLPEATVWQLSRDLEVGYSKGGVARMVSAPQVILATGAQERPFPIPGWTLPGVMTVGAAQSLLKESELAIENAVFAGTGPLLYLAAHQYLEAGIPIKAVIDLTPRGNYLRALPHLPGAMSRFAKIVEGWRWRKAIEKAGITWIKGVDDLRITGDTVATGIEYRRGDTWKRLDCTHVLLHQGVVPNVNISLAAGCESSWEPVQACWTITVDDWFQSSVPGIAVAGDGASIGGAAAAEQRGRIAALGALSAIGKITAMDRDRLARPHQVALRSEMRARPFLDTLFRPARRFRIPQQNEVVVCRCEEISAGQIRAAVDIGCAGPNQLKSFTRCGMGPCQGRLCGLTVSELIADILDQPVDQVGYYRLRPPIKPLRLQELADLTIPSDS